jgi:hypothetical protein
VGIVALLEAGAPDVDVAGGPVAAVGRELSNHDPEASLAGGQRAGDLEAPPGSRRRDLGRVGEVGGIRVSTMAIDTLRVPEATRAQM